MKKFSSLGKVLSSAQMKSIIGGNDEEEQVVGEGGESTINWSCYCYGAGGNWMSGCITISCLELQASRNCGYGQSYHCSHM